MNSRITLVPNGSSVCKHVTGNLVLRDLLILLCSQMVDKLMVQIRDILAAGSTAIPPGDAHAARDLLQDAERSRNILPAFQKITASSDTARPLNVALKDSAASLHGVIQQAVSVRLQHNSEATLLYGYQYQTLIGVAIVVVY